MKCTMNNGLDLFHAIRTSGRNETQLIAKHDETAQLLIFHRKLWNVRIDIRGHGLAFEH